ncbi:MAG: symmetrical bis(5'-nucleosyl)-tetraphosphatase [Gammaproteobacteria bacterium]
MTTYAIGDVQGCYKDLQRLLAFIQFNEQQDTLWFAGDLLNRGSGSLETLQFIRSLGSNTKVVLGNHDLYFLTVAYGIAPQHKGSTIQPILDHKDCDTLCDWLRKQSLVHYDETLNYLMVHAGFPPQWSLTQIQTYAKEVETALQGKKYKEFLQHIYGNQPHQWHEDLAGWDRLRYITNALTRMRLCTAEGALNLMHKGPPPLSMQEEKPWFHFRHPSLKNISIIFGHWAALMGKVAGDNIFALDTGCVWGGSLTALALETQQLFSVACHL